MLSRLKTLLTVYGLLLFGGYTLYPERPTALLVIPVANEVALKLPPPQEEQRWLQNETPRDEQATVGDGEIYPLNEAVKEVFKALHRWWTVLPKVPMVWCVILVDGAHFLYIVIQMLRWTKKHLTQRVHEVPKTETPSRPSCQCWVRTKRASDPELHRIRRWHRMKRRNRALVCGLQKTFSTLAELNTLPQKT